MSQRRRERTRTARRDASNARLLQSLFDALAPRYDRYITPVLGPLSADLVAFAAPRPDDRALEVGTGPGALVKSIAPRVRAIVGLDLSGGLMRTARRSTAHPAAQYLQADAHHLPFAPHTFTLALASFGLNATHPDRALRAIRRVLEPGGRLIFQEWGPIHPADTAVIDALADHVIDEPGETLAALRAMLADRPPAWSDFLQDVDDYREWLEDASFIVDEITECAPLALHLASPEEFLDYKMAWTARYEEMSAMSADQKAAFLADVRGRLAALAEPDGSLIWQPDLFRIRAHVP